MQTKQRKDEVPEKDKIDRRIAMGRGKNGFYHFDFLDIDDPSFLSHSTLLKYRTKNGFHIVDPSHFTKDPRSERLDYLRKYVDPKCPHNAVRIYPNEDYKLLNFPANNIQWCPRVLGIYTMIFPEIASTPVKVDVAPCPPLSFGIYTVTDKDGKKLLGEQRVQ